MSKIRLYGGTSGYIELAAPDVSDDATLTLPTGAAGFVPGDAGIGSNVQTGTITSTFTTTSSSLTDTGLETTITLKSATSSVLLIVHTPSLTTSTGAEIAALTLSNGATSLDTRAYSQTGAFNAVSMAWVDTPGSVGPHTYKVRASIGGGATLSIFAASTARPFITAIEVEA